jgi:cell division transport system permease protein
MNASARTFLPRESVPERRRARGRILPRDKGALSLDLVIGVMAFLAAFALGAVLMAERTAQTWQAGLTGRITVQILPEGAAPPEEEIAAALEFLRATPGIASAVALSDAGNLALIEPFLGGDAVIEALPFPRIIDVRVQPGAAPDTGVLTQRLKQVAPHAVLDDHGRWVARLRAAANTVVLGAAAVLALIAAGTAATVAFATRAGLAAHRDIVELLHLMGARDAFIAQSFEWHYLFAASLAALGGTALAALALWGAGNLEGIGAAGIAFLPPLGLPLADLPWLLLVPVGAAAIAWLTARLSVIAALHDYY